MILLLIHKRIPSLKRRNPNEQVWKVHRNLFSIMMMVFLSNRYVCVFCSITFSVLMLFVCLNKGEKHPRFIRLFISMASIEYFLQRNFCLSIFGQSTFLTWEMVLFLSLSLSQGQLPSIVTAFKQQCIDIVTSKSVQLFSLEVQLDWLHFIVCFRHTREQRKNKRWISNIRRLLIIIFSSHNGEKRRKRTVQTLLIIIFGQLSLFFFSITHRQKTLLNSLCFFFLFAFLFLLALLLRTRRNFLR